MSSERRSVGSSSLEQLARSCRYVLVDFDGPMSDVFAGLPAPLVAKRLRGLVENHGLVDALVDSDDPMQVLHAAQDLPPAQRDEIERALRLAEVEAVASSKPTPGADRLSAACQRTGRAVAVVSNNSDEAVRAYLTMHELDPFVAVVSARRSSDPALMKPNPYLVDQAVLELAAEPAACVLVGDTLTDIEAAAAAGVRSVGYANKPGKSGAMAIAGADLIITAMDELTQAISHS